MAGKSLYYHWYVFIYYSIEMKNIILIFFYGLGVFLFANCVNSFLTNVGKVAVGRLRPHFIPSCFKKYSYRDFCQDPNEWFVNYTCIGETSDAVKEKDGAYDIRYVEYDRKELDDRR
jgi:hypothetical protein